MQALPVTSSPVGAPPDGAVRAQLEEAARQFEGLFIQQMLKSMRQSSGALAGEQGFLRQNPDDPLLGLADQLLADQLAGQRAFGIADMLLRQLLPAEPLKPGPAGDALSVQMNTIAPPSPEPQP